MIEKKIKGLKDLNGVYITGKGMVFLKSEDDVSMTILNMESGFFTPNTETVVTLNLGKPAISALLREIGVDAVFDDGSSEYKTERVQPEACNGRDLQNKALDRLCLEKQCMIPNARDIRAVGKEMAILSAIASTIRENKSRHHFLATVDWLDEGLKHSLIDLGYSIEKVDNNYYKISW